MHTRIKNIFALWLASCKELLQAICVPAHCAFCKIMIEQHEPLCGVCLAGIRRLLPAELQLTATKKISIYAIGAYEGALSALIRAKQSRNVSAAYHLGVLAADYLADFSFPVEVVVPVPLHWRRYAHRGYNQAQEMAAVIAQRRGIHHAQLIKRVRNTTFQLLNSADERHKNVQDAFILTKKAQQYAGKHLLLVDDLMTTGATLSAVARTFLPLKPASITVVVAARVV